MPFSEALTRLVLISPQAATTTVTGSAVDLQGYMNSGAPRAIKAIYAIGSQAGTSPSNTIKIQHSDTSTAADFTDITGAAWAAVTTTGTAADELHFVTTKRYIRALSTLTANTTQSVVAVEALVRERFA